MRPSEKTNEIAVLRERVAALEAKIEILVRLTDLNRQFCEGQQRSIETLARHAGLWRPEGEPEQPSGPVQ